MQSNSKLALSRKLMLYYAYLLFKLTQPKWKTDSFRCYELSRESTFLFRFFLLSLISSFQAIVKYSEILCAVFAFVTLIRRLSVLLQMLAIWLTSHVVCVWVFFSFSAIVRDVTKYFSCSTRIWRFSVSISVQWFKCACVRVCVCVWATHALLIIHWIYILIQRIVSFLSLRLIVLNVCTRKMCVLWHLFISVETVREYLASKWEVRLTIYDCGMEYDSPWIELHIHILHTMRKHIYVNEARRWCLSGLSYRVYICV